MWRILFVVVSFDFNAYCKGICQGRYSDGFAVSEKECFCGDRVPINLKQRFDVPKRYEKKNGLGVYYGADEMHVAPSEPEAPPTAPLDF